MSLSMSENFLSPVAPPPFPLHIKPFSTKYAARVAASSFFSPPVFYFHSFSPKNTFRSPHLCIHPFCPHTFLQSSLLGSFTPLLVAAAARPPCVPYHCTLVLSPTLGHFPLQAFSLFLPSTQCTALSVFHSIAPPSPKSNVSIFQNFSHYLLSSDLCSTPARNLNPTQW